MNPTQKSLVSEPGGENPLLRITGRSQKEKPDVGVLET